MTTALSVRSRHRIDDQREEAAVKKGILVIVSGFSGAGKGTVTKALAQRFDNYALSISATSRAPRNGEVEGRDYFYKTREEFEELIRQNALIEHAQYVGNYYGTPKSYVEEQLQAGKDVILEIEVQGALQVKEQYPEAITIFMTTPTAEILKERLVGRGTETPEKVASRLKRAGEEAELMDRYDYVIVNDDLEECIAGLHRLIQSQHSRASQNKAFIDAMKAQLKEI
jgi:guanylate kinase